MKTTGYSGKSLVQKLGLKLGLQAVVVHAPPHYSKLLGPDDLLIDKVEKVISSSDFIHAFFIEKRLLEKEFPTFVQLLNEKGMIWISWPKKSSLIQSDLDENVVRNIGLALGIVDVKVCAVDENWSGLKFLRRKK